MKASELKKDSQINIRINSMVKKKLEEMGFSMQALFDMVVDSEIELEIELKDNKLVFGENEL